MSSLDIKWTNLERVLNEFADRFKELARQNLENNNTNASGNLRDSLDELVKNVEIGEDWYSVKVSLADYWTYIEEGTGPGHVPDARSQYWPKIEPLKEWANTKPGVPKDPGFPYAVRWKIHEEGTEPQPFVAPAKEQAIREFSAAIDQAIEADVDEYIEEQVVKMLETWLGKK